MSRSTNDLQNPATTASNDDVEIVSGIVSGQRSPGESSANRRGSTEKLLNNENNPTITIESKASSLAPSAKASRPGSRSGSVSDHEQDNVSAITAASLTPSTGGSSVGTSTKVKLRECPLCLARQPSINFPQLSYCHHRSCHACLVQYLHMEILESRVNVTCPECNEPMHPNDIYKILSIDDSNLNFIGQGRKSSIARKHLIEKYEEFSVRRVLMSDPDTRWCPAPDCSYAVIATGCAACPELRCQRPGCGTLFCYHCKMTWHPNQTCDEARAQRGSFATSPIHIDTTIRPGDIKACPRCRTFIVKMNDGSCNHMVCALCGAEFCWLCLREISDLHYLSPSGCTFWGKKPWSRKKKLLWQLGMLVGAPVGIALVAGLAVPAIIFGVPVWVGRKVHQKLKDSSKAKRRFAVAGSVFGSVLMSPVLASMAVGVGVPIMLAYVYGVVPLSLCRNGSCGVRASSSGVRLDLDDDILAMTGGNGSGQDGSHEKSQLLKDVDKQDASTVTGFSMQSGSTQHKLQIQADICSTGTGGGMMSNTKQRRSSMESGATASLCGERCFINYEEASTKALAGSTYCDDKSVHTVGSLLEGGGGSYYVEPDQTSMKGLSGSVGGNTTAADAKSSKSIGSGAAVLGHCSNANTDNASTVAMAGSICGVTIDITENQCSKCGGRKSSGTSALRHHSSMHHHHHHHHSHHVQIDDHSIGIEDRNERECSIGPRVTRFADDTYSYEPTSTEMNLLERHYGILPIDEESNSVSASTTSKLLTDEHPSVSSKLSASHRQSMEKSSSLRRFLFLRSGTNSSDEQISQKSKRLSNSSETENMPGQPTTAVDLKSICTSIGGVSSEEKRCRLHRDECQCDDAEFLLLPPDAFIVQSNKFSSSVLAPGGSGRRFSMGRNVPMKKSRSWSALLLDGGQSGQGTTSSMAAELWSTVRGAFTSGNGGGGDADSDSVYHHHYQRYGGKNSKRSSGSGFVQRLKPGRRATVSNSANMAASAKKVTNNKKTQNLDTTSSCTSLPDTSFYGTGEMASVSITLPTRQRTPSDSSPSRSGIGNKRLSSTLANFFKPSNEK